jgi:hypothetical protein
MNIERRLTGRLMRGDAESSPMAGRAGPAIAAVVLAFLSACKGSSPPPQVATIEVMPNAATRQVGETVQLSAAVKDAGGNLLEGFTVTWSTSDASVASVSSAGLVTANSIGMASISAAAGGRSGSAVITVAGTPVANVTVAPATDTLLVDEALQLTATVRDEDGELVTDREVSWTSSDPNVASVNAQGLVTGVDDGVATISATIEGVSGSASVTVWGPCSVALADTIAVGDTLPADLSNGDCRLDDNSYADAYYLTVAADMSVRIDMLAAGFDTWLWLLELLPTGELELVAFNDDVVEGNTDSRIDFDLVAGSDYFILANSFDPNTFGDYTVSVTDLTGAARIMGGSRLKSGKAPLTRSLRVARRR